MKENDLDPFLEALLDKLTNECKPQMEAVKKGMRLVTGNAYSFLDYMNWHDIMELAEKDKLKNYSSELLKEATVYENAAKDDDVIV